MPEEQQEPEQSAFAQMLANPMIYAIIASWVMRIMAVGGSVLVTLGWMTPNQMATVDWKELTGGVMVVASFYYGTRSRVKTQQKLLTSLANPHAKTEAEVDQIIASAKPPTITTPKDTTPVMAPPKVP